LPATDTYDSGRGPNLEAARTQDLQRELDRHRAEQRRRGTLTLDGHATEARTSAPDNTAEQVEVVDKAVLPAGADHDLGS
ncbi:hypothetical protein, partial [Nocardia farcinica]